MAKLANGKFYCCLDLSNSFHQVELDDESIPLTAFQTEKGLFEYKRMPFGLKNATASFSSRMSIVFHNLEFCQCFVDDVLMCGRSFSETLDRLSSILDRIIWANLKLKPTKCHIFKKEAKILGFRVNQQGYTADSEKVREITNWISPTSAKQTKSFLKIIWVL